MSYTDPPAPPPPQPPGGGYGMPPGGDFGGKPAYGSPAAAGNNKKAIWSLVTGILGLCCCGVIAGVPAIFLSRSAKGEIAVTGQGGSGLATAGLVLGILSIVSTVLSIVLYATGNLTFSGNISSG